MANNREALREELMIQEVILESLQGETFDDAEEQREDARKEISRLKRALKALPKIASGDEGGPSNNRAQAQNAASQASASPQEQPEQSRARTPASAGPSRPRLPSAVMETPRKPLASEHGESPSLTVRSRKRDFEATGLHPGTASTPQRRTAPGLFSGPQNTSWSPSSDDQIEIIDLTGADVDYDSSKIAEQLRLERERKKIADRQKATTASQTSSQNASGPSRASGSEQPSAFSRMMATQRLNQSQSVQEISDDEFEAPLPSLVTRGPAYGASAGPSANGQLLRGVNQPNPNPYYQLPTGNLPMPGAFPGAPMMLGMPIEASALGRGTLTPLSDIINRTSSFDYVNGVDGDGNMLPSHLMDFINNSFHDPRVTEQELDDLLKNIRPDMDIPEDKRDGTPEGLKNALYPHQALALSWMKQMEEGTNKGGILADDMGLGKTISTLALILSRPAKSRPKTNLIVGPVALIRQWEEEIHKKTKPSHRLSVFVYHNTKATIDDMLKYDVVLTTYGTLAQEMKRLDNYLESNAGRNIDFTDRAIASKFPLLNPRKSKFYRVILDEAQCIKNRNTKTAKACHRLSAVHRWCLSGTPMMNGVLEIFSLVHFLRIKPYCVWDQFRKDFSPLFNKNSATDGVAMHRFRALLKAIMLRRKKDSELDGKPILVLPAKREQVIYADLSQDERDYYDQLEKASKVTFNKYLREGSVGKNYSSILVLLLRLRQACCHPHLNLDVEDTAPSVTTEELLELVKKLDEAIVVRIKEADAFECPICYDAVQSPTFFIPCGHDTCQQCLTRLVDSAAASNLQQGYEGVATAKCPVCRGSFDPKKCFNYETFQQVHMPERVEAPVKDEEDESDSSGEEEDDDEYSSEDVDDDEVDSYGDLRDFIVRDDVESGSDRERIKSEKKEKKERKKKKKGKKKMTEIKPSMLRALRHDASKSRAAYKKYMGYLRKTWLPAAKVSECMKLLEEIYKTGEKTIVFSQWTLLLDLLEVAMWHDQYPGKMRRYDGSMSAEHRFQAAVDFRDKKDVKVMLVSLRAGNAGLNLTSASRVIIMDPFWNPYIEMQAVDRAYRIGQMKEVTVYRILTKETVEDRIVELQDRKKAMVEAALDEAESMKIGRLGVNDLKFLFTGH
ncbi:SNF2 family N-terminal domain-containing protein [Trichoderma gracile]